MSEPKRMTAESSSVTFVLHAIPDEAPASQPCERCGHLCPDDRLCDVCTDNMKAGDLWCVECDRAAIAQESM